MIEPRLKTEIRISAHLRRAQAGGAFATIVRKGDPDAGAVAVKLFIGRGEARLFIQSRDLDGNPVWREPLEGDQQSDDIETRIDRWIEKESSIDPDIWVVEIEDREGRAFLD
ncbi:DUF1491 family protein [Hyphococcus lacteus]|uniref:DUF1491 family protein n=1 Tax=Hyphococcus lacteus TaxID=3143536 RepID=A0ABV3Z078_9PROT